MAKEDKTKEQKQKARFAAMEGLRPSGGFPMPPRKAVKEARKASRTLPYPIAPYPDASLRELYGWAQREWWKLGRWQNLALPFIFIVALLTWKKEKATKDARWIEVEREAARQVAAEAFGAFGRPPIRKRKLFGFIPLP